MFKRLIRVLLLPIVAVWVITIANVILITHPIIWIIVGPDDMITYVVDLIENIPTLGLL